MRVMFWAAGLLFVSLVGARAEGDPAAGKTVYGKCAVCHSVKEGENKIGPSMFGIVGRPAHSAPGFKYSEALGTYDATWNATTLDGYLADPRKAVPGTRMVFPGLKSEKEREDVIAYLGTLK